MLTPQTLQALPKEMVELVNECQMDILSSIAKKLVKSDFKLTSSAEWQLYRASVVNQSTAEVTKILAQFTGKSKRQISKLYTDACKEAINNDAKIYRLMGKDADSFFRSVAFSNTLKAGIKNANSMTSNLTRSMVKSSRQTVTHLMDKAYIQIESGAFSYQEAIAKAVDELASQGITRVTYPSGHSDWADVAVRRAVMTGVSQTAGQIQLDCAAELGTDLVEVTSHGGARPSHAEWQGRIFSISGKSKKYPSLRAVTGYGTGAGLKGWNCRHDFFPFVEGISQQTHFPVKKSENDKEYALSQQQRAMERSIRESKRKCSAYGSAVEGTNDPVLKQQLQNKYERSSATLKAREKRLTEFCDKNDLKKQSDRSRVSGFGRSQAQKAIASSKQYIDKKTKSAILNSKRDGKTRADMYSVNWQTSSLSEKLSYFGLTKSSSVNSKGKIIYSGDNTSVQIVYDVNGDYFRIMDTSVKGKGKYLDINGKSALNKTENGKTKGRSNDEFQRETHFNNSDISGKEGK